MGGTAPVSALKGIGIGFLTPFCTYSAIPMFLGLHRAGVRPAGYVAFIVAAPVLDPILFGALVLIAGWSAALVYLSVAFAAAFALALYADRLDVSRLIRPSIRPALVPRRPASAIHSGPSDRQGAFEGSCEATATGWRGWSVELRSAASGASNLLRKLAPIVLIGVGIGLAIELAVPPDFVASLAGGDNPLAIPLAAGLGTPLYVNTGLFVPIADSLSAVGVGIGAIVALTIAGAGANLPEFVILGRVARAPAVLSLCAYVFAVAIIGGYLAQAIV